MVLRLILSAALVLNPLAVFAQAKGAKPNKGLRGTYLEEPSAPDWIVEGLAARAVKNNARARELFIAAKTQLIAEKLPVDALKAVIIRLDDLIVSVGGSVTKTMPHENTPWNTSNTGAGNAAANASGNTPTNALTNAPQVPVNSAATEDSFFQNDSTNTNTTAPTESIPSSDHAVVDPRGEYSIADSDAQVLKSVLANDSEGRELLWRISSARMAANAQQDRLKEIIRRDLGEDELSNMDSFGSGYGMGYGSVQPGLVYELLSYVGMFDKDYRKEILKMKEKFDGSSPDEMAMKIIRDAANYGALTGAAFGFWHGLKKAGPISGDDNYLGQGQPGKSQLSADEIMIFLNNANSFVKMAALYEVEVDQLQKQLVGMMALGFAMFAMKNSMWGKTPKPPKPGDDASVLAKLFGSYKPQMEALGRAFGRAKTNAEKTKLLEEKLAQLTEKMGALEGGTIPGVGRAAVGPETSNRNAGALSNDPLDPDQPPADPADPEDPNKKPSKPKKPRRPTTPREWALRVVYGAAGAGINAAHGYAISWGTLQLAKYFYGGAYNDAQETQNRNFLRLMNSSKGIAFLKLLVHSMHAGKEKVDGFTADQAKDPHIAFIMNLSRSFGNCSRDDYVAMDAAKKAGGALQNELTAARAALGANGSNVEQFTETDLKKLYFSCPLQKNPYNFNLLMREMKSFNAISDRSVAYLRTSVLRDRIKMAQLLLQFQYVDGEQTTHEEKFYREVASRLLGFDSKEQNHYVQVLAGFMKSEGGVVPNPASPSGFSIAKIPGKKLKNPYDYKLAPGSTEAPFEILAVDWDETADASAFGK
ncbi:MAG: hypothetical protein NDI61_08540 [Bdellovibrionaceae bacterium]|nr:hypothetical protein [Pseudobdellovibrionaceae bacterium]